MGHSAAGCCHRSARPRAPCPSQGVHWPRSPQKFPIQVAKSDSMPSRSPDHARKDDSGRHLGLRTNQNPPMRTIDLILSTSTPLFYPHLSTDLSTILVQENYCLSELQARAANHPGFRKMYCSSSSSVEPRKPCGLAKQASSTEGAWGGLDS